MTINSKKKKKALDNYISKKLKKDETEKLFLSISKSSWSSDLLLSSKRLGQRESKKEIKKKTNPLFTSQVENSTNSIRNGNVCQIVANKNYSNDMSKKSIPCLNISTQSLTENSDFDSDLDSLDDPLSDNDNESKDLENDRESQRDRQPEVTVAETDKDAIVISPISGPPFTYIEEDIPSQCLEESDELSLPLPLSEKTKSSLFASVITDADRLPRVFIPINRPEPIQLAREALPIYLEESHILEAVADNPVTVICGETGSGKTTQVPQFLYEAGYAPPNKPGKILITQPRRMAAISMAKRVSEEMNDASIVGYQIRYESNMTSNNKILFMTDGLLLKIIESDFLLSQYNVVIIDEAHERNINTDILLGLLTRIVRLRAKMFSQNQHNSTEVVTLPLKLIIMSATLNVKEFTENSLLFPKGAPPIVHIASRQFPITIHYARKTMIDYLDGAFKKVAQIHTKLPPGNILVFVTGQSEVWNLVRRLRKSFPVTEKIQKSASPLIQFEELTTPERDVGQQEWRDDVKSKITFSVDDMELDSVEEQNMAIMETVKEVEQNRHESDSPNLLSVDRLSKGLNENENEHVSSVDYDEEDDEEQDIEFFDQRHLEESSPLIVLPLYSLLPLEEQLKVFQLGRLYESTHRVCIVSTNIAETSITIPGIVYVVDTGRVKERFYGKGSASEETIATGLVRSTEDYVERYQVSWISKASSDQRAGRAGRCGPGHIYRLYSRPVYHDLFLDHTVPEICKIPLDPLILSMKSMGLDNVIHFPYPTSPDSRALARAEMDLLLLGALEIKERNKPSVNSADPLMQSVKKDSFCTVITELGRKMSVFPLSPRLSKILVQGNVNGCLPYLVNLVSALSLGDPFVYGREDETTNETRVGQNDESHSKSKDVLDSHIVHNWNGSSPISDIVRLLTVFGAFEYERENQRESFCFSNNLRFKTLKEMTLLKNQIVLILRKYFGMDVVCERLPPPSSSQIQSILKIYLSAHGDHVARLTDTPVQSRKGRKTYAYQTVELASDAISLITNGNIAMLPELLKISSEYAFLHSSSCLNRIKLLPKWIMYEKKIMVHANDPCGASSDNTGHIVLKNCSAILDENWLAYHTSTLCHFSKPLSQPLPFYCAEKDAVYCYSYPKFARLWTLLALPVRYPSSHELKQLWTSSTTPNEDHGLGSEYGQYKWFGRLLLEGEIIPELAEWRDQWTSPPSTMTKPYAFSKIIALYTTLAKAKIDSKVELCNILCKNPKYLLQELLMWLPNHCHKPFSEKWPPKGFGMNI